MINPRTLNALDARSMILALIFGLLLFPALTFAQTPKRIYIAPDDHTDYMWTADEATYQQAFLQMTDFYLNQMDSTAGNPSAYQGRWNCDGSLWMWTYERNRSAADFQRFINRVRDGHMSVPLTALVSVYGGTPAEAVLRGMYYPGQIERRYNLRFPIAVAMENQTLPYGLGSLWAGAGARYSWRGICNCATFVPNPGDREHDIYWWQGPDGTRLLMKWNSFFANDSIGGYAEARRPTEAINITDFNNNFIARYPYPVIGIFGKGWDDLQTYTNEFITTAQSQTNANRQIIVSNELDFFQDFETNYGPTLPTLSCSYGNEWEILVASLAEVSARMKRSTEKLRSAEALATLVSLQNPTFMNNRNAARDQAWMNFGLYWEHDWTADGPVPRTARADWQRRLADGIDSYVDTLQADAVSALGSMIRRSGSNLRFYAFNPLGWARTDKADIPYSDTNPVHVVDLTTGLETPSQIVFINGQRFLRILARDVPSAGYKVFEVQPGPGITFTDAATVGTGVIESDIYRITLSNRGAITSLIDKTRGREMAQTVNGRAINDLGSGTGSIQVENSGPVSVTLLANATGPLNHTTRITIIRDTNRIEITNDINQNFSSVQTWGFGFNLSSPDVWHEEVGAVIRAKTLANGGHYSGRNARYDWLTMNHFADMSGGGVGVTISNADCYFMKLGNSTNTVLDTGTPLISVLAGGQVDSPILGIQNQGGDAHFLQRFALQTHGAYDTGTAMRFSLEHQNSLVTGIVNGSGAAYPENSYSLVAVSDQNTLLWALKPAEEGIEQGIIARIWNLSNNPVNAGLYFSRPAASAERTTHIETDIGDVYLQNGVPVALLGARQMQTLRVKLARRTLFDFDGDGRTDYSVYRPSAGTWYVQQSGNGAITAQFWGNSTDKLVPADYDGDGKTDYAVWRPGDATFYILQSSNGTLKARTWGLSSDLPLAGDFDGDGKSDIAVFRPGTGTFLIQRSTDNGFVAQNWGTNGDVPVTADYDGDGRTDFAVWRQSSGAWYILLSSNGTVRAQAFGFSTDKPVAGDYDGDGKADLAVFRPSNGSWYIINSSNNSLTGLAWGISTDRPVPGDYDGDGRNDFAVYRPGLGAWFINQSSNGVIASATFGNSTDAPVPASFIIP